MTTNSDPMFDSKSCNSTRLVKSAHVSRRDFMRVAGSLAAATAVLPCIATQAQAYSKQDGSSMVPFYIGTYFKNGVGGIYRSALSLADGSMAEPKLVASVENASFLAIHPTLDVLYAVSELRRGSEREGASVLAFKILPGGDLESIGRVSSAGDGPCYVSTNGAGTVAMAANYGSGSIAMIMLDENGSLRGEPFGVQHQGKSVDPSRQAGPHAHCILPDPSDTWACAVDLGLDQILVYRIDAAEGKLLAGQAPPLALPPGSGPRHLAFHPNGKRAVVILEMSSKIASLNWNALSGKFDIIEIVSTLPAGYDESNSTAEVLFHPSGKFVYGSNRGHDSIAVFAMDNDSGKLKLIDHTSTGGKTPRNFRLDPEGKFLLAENQNSDSIHSFKIDQETGKLTPTGNSISVVSPGCIKFFPSR